MFIDVVKPHRCRHCLGVHHDHFGFDDVRQLSKPHQPGHAGTAFERVEMPCQLDHGGVVSWFCAPGAHAVTHLRDDLFRLFKENG